MSREMADQVADVKSSSFSMADDLFVRALGELPAWRERLGGWQLQINDNGVI